MSACQLTLRIGASPRFGGRTLIGNVTAVPCTRRKRHGDVHPVFPGVLLLITLLSSLCCKLPPFIPNVQACTRTRKKSRTRRLCTQCRIVRAPPQILDPYAHTLLQHSPRYGTLRCPRGLQNALRRVTGLNRKCLDYATECCSLWCIAEGNGSES